MDGKELIFNDEAMDAIVDAAFANGTGARGLRGIMETVLTDFMFEAADSKDRKLLVNKSCVERALQGASSISFPVTRKRAKAS